MLTSVGAIIVGSLIIIILRVRFNGPALADTIEIILNSDIRGRVEVESVEWPIGSLPKVATGGWIPVEIRGIRVYDDGGMLGEEVEDEKRELLLRIDRMTAEIDAHSLILGHHDFVIRNLRVPDGGYVLLREVEEPYPLHLYDTSVVSLASAFYSRLSLGFRAGLSATSSKIFDIRDFDIQDATVEIIYPGTHMIMENVDTTGFVHSDFSDPLKPKVYFSLSPTAERGIMCVGEVESDRHLEKPYGSIDAARDSGVLCTTDASKAAHAESDADAAARVVYEIQLTEMAIHRMTQLPTDWPRDATAHDVYWNITANTPDGSHLQTDGALLDYWLGYYGGNYDIRLIVTNGGPLMDVLTDELAGGDDVRLEARVSGPALGPKVELDIYKLDIRLLDDDAQNPLDLHLARASAAFDMVTEQGSLRDTVAQGADGRVRLEATFGLDPFHFNLQARIERPIDLRSYVPSDVIEALGSGRAPRGRLDGSLEVSGDGVTQKIAPMDLSFGNAHITGELFAEDSHLLHAQKLSVSVGKTRVVTTGQIDLEDGQIGLNIDLESEDLAERLRVLHAPNLARGATGRAWVRGTLESPSAHAQIDFTGVEIVDTVAADFDYHNQELTLNHIQSDSLGGKVHAQGRVDLHAKTPRIVNLLASAERLDLSRIPYFGGTVTGRLSGHVQASGRIDRLDATATANFDGLTIAEDEYKFIKPLRLRIKADGSKELGFHAERIGGGSLATETAIDGKGRLSGDFTMKALPLQQLGVLGGMRESPVGGVVSTKLTLGGSLDAPMATGDFNWQRSWFERAFLGDGSFRIKPIGQTGIQVSGTLSQGDVDVVADIQTTAPYNTEFNLKLRRVEIDRFAPELAEELGIRGWISGDILVATPLIVGPGWLPKIKRAHISEISLWIDNEDPLGRPTPIQIRNDLDTPLAFTYQDGELVLAQAVTLIGPGGAEFKLSGRMDGEELDFHLTGDIQLGLLQPYVRGYVRSIEGRLQVALTLGGTLSKPAINARIDVCDKDIHDSRVCIGDRKEGGDVVIRPNVQDAIVYIRRGGLIVMDNSQISVAGLSVVVSDPYTDEISTLELGGGVGLEDFKPVRLSLLAYGELSGKLLMIMAPEIFSRASGKARINFTLGGTVSEPSPDIDVYFQRQSALSFTLRGLRREIRLTSGALSLSQDELEIANLGGSFDSEGTIRDVYGVIGLHNWEPTYVDLRASADSVTYRLPGHLDMVLNVNDLSITSQGSNLVGALSQPPTETATDIAGDTEVDIEDELSLEPAEIANVARLLISGSVEVVDGRYVRNFNLIEDGLTPVSTTSTTSATGATSSKPFYDEIPLLGNAALDVTIETRGFYVQNNLADIQLTGRVAIGGIVRDPQIAGSIEVVQGEFKIPGARARFTRTEGSVAFEPNKEIPEGSPVLNLTSESDYRDPSGQEHLVTLNITGSLGLLNWDLYTSSGLNKGQTLTMLFSGRTPEELRKTLGDETVGRDPNRIDPTADQSANLADQWLKDLTGDFISLLIEDKLKNLTPFDVARLEIGTDSIGLHVEKEWVKRLHTQVDLEQTSRERVLVGTGEVPLTDTVSVEGKYITTQSEDELLEDRSDKRVRLVKRFIWF